MKRALPILALLAALAAVLAFTLRRGGSGAGSFPANRAAELAPGDAVAFFQVAEVDRTVARWQASDLRAVTQEPEWQAAEWQRFLDGWSRRMASDYSFGPLVTILPELRKVEPAGLFVAATDLRENPQRKLVGGIKYRAKKSEVEGAVRTLKDGLRKVWPGAKSELSTHHGVEIESLSTTAVEIETAIDPISRYPSMPPPPKSRRIVNLPASSPPLAVHLAYRDDWLFFATDRALLEGTLDRFLRTPGGAPSLATNADFAECHQHALPTPDLVLWVRWEPPIREYTARWFPRFATAMNIERGDAAPSTTQALHYSWQIDGPVRDRLYLQQPVAPEAPPLEDRTLALTRPDDRGYVVLNFPVLRGDTRWLEYWSTSSRLSLAMRLAPRGLKFDSLWDAFGPEVGFIFLKKREEELPDFVVALEIRDAARARHAAVALATSQADVKVTTEGETTRWDWRATSAESFAPPMVLTKTHLFLGTSGSGVLEVERRAGGSSPSLAANPAYAAATKSLRPENGARFYFDPRELLDWDGSITAWALLAQNWPNSGTSPFPSKALVRHLSPAAMSVRTEGQGWVVESSLSLVEISVILDLLKPKEDFDFPFRQR